MSRLPRVCHEGTLGPGATVSLNEGAGRHVARVLRLRAGDPLVVFDGAGGEYDATVDSAHRDVVTVRVGEARSALPESPLALRLLQGVSRGERMDYTLQKATELGVSEIHPVLTRRTVVKLSADRAARRRAHWRQVVVAASEQCGRARVPAVGDIVTLADVLSGPPPGQGLLLDAAAAPLADMAEPGPDGVVLLVGPEGGLAPDEKEAAVRAGFRPVSLGPRVLRTETAALVAISILQSRWGDLA